MCRGRRRRRRREGKPYLLGAAWQLLELALTPFAIVLGSALFTVGFAGRQQTIHDPRDLVGGCADRGSAMTSKCVAQLLCDLVVVKTHSWPHVSNDNPFSEAQFKTPSTIRTIRSAWAVSKMRRPGRASACRNTQRRFCRRAMALMHEGGLRYVHPPPQCGGHGEPPVVQCGCDGGLTLPNQ